MIRREMVRRLLIAIAVAAVATTAPLAENTAVRAADAAFATDQAVHWSVDPATQAITVSVGMAFYSACADQSCPPPDANAVAKIVDAIKRYWNHFEYKCSKVNVEVTARAVKSQAEAGRGEIDVGLDTSAMSGFHAVTRGFGDNEAYLSELPADAIQPIHDPSNPTTWAADSAFQSTWAHEFGHVLGLADNYDPVDGTQVRPGAIDDLMFASQHGVVSQEMIDRVVRRSGKVDDSKLSCACPASRALPLGPLENGALLAVANPCPSSPPSSGPGNAPRAFEGTITREDDAQGSQGVLTATGVRFEVSQGMGTETCLASMTCLQYVYKSVAASITYHWQGETCVTDWMSTIPADLPAYGPGSIPSAPVELFLDLTVPGGGTHLGNSHVMAHSTEVCPGIPNSTGDAVQDWFDTRGSQPVSGEGGTMVLAGQADRWVWQLTGTN